VNASTLGGQARISDRIGNYPGMVNAEAADDRPERAAFGLPWLSQQQAAQVTAVLRLIRAAPGDVWVRAVFARPRGLCSWPAHRWRPQVERDVHDHVFARSHLVAGGEHVIGPPERIVPERCAARPGRR
jgi:hypothetical protein